MTIKEAILKSLEDLGGLCSSNDVYQHIINKKYYDTTRWTQASPVSVVGAQLGTFIRVGDTRVKRIKKDNLFFYYLTKNEEALDIDTFAEIQNEPPKNQPKSKKEKSFSERDLHKLLSSYLKNSGIYTKTIFHEQSSNGKDNNQIWTHPDMVGIRFLKLQNKINQNFLKAINRMDTFKLSSYELKKEINSDSELKKAFFQAVSNSSWANYGYLVAFEISDNLTEEMERLNQSFGIGIIELNANPYQSKILFQAKYRDLDFKTMDKLCKMNKEFEKFIEQAEKLMTAEERYYKSTEKELDEFCDDCFASDSEVQKYCIEKNIPIEEEEENKKPYFQPHSKNKTTLVALKSNHTPNLITSLRGEIR